MAFFNSEDSVFQINDGSSLRDISAYITSIEGLPSAVELREVTALGAAGHAWSRGIEREITITLEVWWSDDASVGPDTVFRLVRALTAATAWDYGPEGKSTGEQKYSGTCWLENYIIHTRVGTKLMATVSLRVEGAVTVGTYS